MYVAPGARAKLLEKRREQFFEQYVVAMLREAEKLGITTEQVIRDDSEKGQQCHEQGC